MRKLLFFAALLAWAAPGLAWAETPDPLALLEQAQASLRQGQKGQCLTLMDQAGRILWNQLGLEVGQALLTREEAQGFGMFNPREDNNYALAEPIIIYIEPRGYRVTSPQPGLYAFGIRVDAALLSMAGEVLWSKERALVNNVLSRYFNREFFITVYFRTSADSDAVAALLEQLMSPTAKPSRAGSWASTETMPSVSVLRVRGRHMGLQNASMPAAFLKSRAALSSSCGVNTSWMCLNPSGARSSALSANLSLTMAPTNPSSVVLPAVASIGMRPE